MMTLTYLGLRICMMISLKGFRLYTKKGCHKWAGVKEVNEPSRATLSTNGFTHMRPRNELNPSELRYLHGHPL